MPLNSYIEWTDATWNPVRGCTKISPGCKHCYAETFAERFRGVKDHPYEQGFDLRLVPEKSSGTPGWNRSLIEFTKTSFGERHLNGSISYVRAVSQVMVTANWHTYQVLTKRSDRLAESLSGNIRFAAEQEHIWWGVSVEDRKYGLPRIDDLRQAPAKVRFLSIEPLLEDLGEIDLSGISWVIVGGESGPGARTMKREWVISIRDQCLVQRVPFFFKQWGGVRKARNGRKLDGRTYDQYPERSASAVPDRATCIAFAETVLRSTQGIGPAEALIAIRA